MAEETEDSLHRVTQPHFEAASVKVNRTRGRTTRRVGLAAQLSLAPTTGRPVLDRTGLVGRYTFTANLQEIPPGTADQKEFVIRCESPVFSALREQLGLKLEPQQASIEMLVIDHADKIPTED